MMSTKRQKIFNGLSLVSLLICIILTILPLLPRATVPLLSIRTSPRSASLQHIPQAVVKPVAEVSRILSGQEGDASTTSPLKEVREYFAGAIGAGYTSGIHPSSGSAQSEDELSSPGSKRDLGNAEARVPKHAMDGSVPAEATEEYSSLRHAGITADEAVAMVKQDFSLLPGQEGAGMNVRVGTLDVCSNLGKENMCQTVKEFKEGHANRIASLTSFPIDTPAPMLLVISLAAQFSLFLTILGSFVPWRSLAAWLQHSARPAFLPGRFRSQDRNGSKTDSVMQLIDHRPFHRIQPSDPSEAGDVRFGAFGWAFVALWLAAFSFALAGAGILLALSMDARNRAEIAGDAAKLGPGAYLLAVLPFTLLLPLECHLVPVMAQYTAERRFGTCLFPRSKTGQLSPISKPISKLDQTDDGKSEKSFTCTPYVVPYASRTSDMVTGHGDNGSIRHDNSTPDVERADKKEKRWSDGRTEVDEGEWTMITPAPKAAHLAP